MLRLATLALVPVAIGVDLLWPERKTLVFLLSAGAVIPLAGHIGSATETLAERMGSGIGALLNATFGNATELVIGALALRHGLSDMVKASITGSIIGNVLLVFGAAALAGGLRHRIQRFNRTAASTGTTMLLLSAIALIVPAMFHWVSRSRPGTPQLRMDTEISVVLVATYALSLVFTLKTHRETYGTPAHAGAADASGPHRGSLSRPVLTLLTATAAVGYVAEQLVNSISDTAGTLGLTPLFVGVVVVALVGNAAEHYSAVTLAWRNQMDASLGIAVGSSTQIALFVAPVLVFLSYVIAPQPMDLLFTGFEVVAIGLSVAIISFIAHDGETHWMEGVQLLAVYVILALGFYFLPAAAAPGS